MKTEFVFLNQVENLLTNCFVAAFFNNQEVSENRKEYGPVFRVKTNTGEFFSNLSQIEFNVATVDWGTVNRIVLLTSKTMYSPIFSFDIEPRTIHTGDKLIIPAGSLGLIINDKDITIL